VEELGGPVPEDVLSSLSGDILVVVTLGEDDLPLPEDREVLLASGSLTAGPGDRQSLPRHTAVWMWQEPRPRVRDPRARR